MRIIKLNNEIRQVWERNYQVSWDRFQNRNNYPKLSLKG
jgi:hypothetical protein